MFESKESKIIREDQKSHPNCHYSQSYQTMCSNRTGKYSCEKISKIMRHCPGERPVELYEESKSGNTQPNDHIEGFGIDNNLGSLLDGFFNFGRGDHSRSMDSFFNDFFQLSPPPPLDRRIDPFNDRRFPQEAERPQLLPPHKIPKGKTPIQSSESNFDGYVSGPPESI